MKLVGVTVVVVGLFCNSALAMAEGPVPFSALMQPAGATPGIPPLDDSKDQSAAGSTQQVHKTHMTTGGKIMTCVGTVLFVTGAVVVVGTGIAGLSGFGSSAKIAAGYAGGGGAMAGGATLIIFGEHRRSTQ